MPDRGKGKTFRAAGGHSSNLLFDDGMNELDFQSALHVLVHAHMGISRAVFPSQISNGILLLNVLVEQAALYQSFVSYPQNEPAILFTG